MADTIKTTVRLSSFVDGLVREFSKQNGEISFSNAMELILRGHFQNAPQTTNVNVEDIQNGLRTKQVHSKLTDAEFSLLSNLAKERAMSKGEYLAELFRANSTGSPRLCSQEIEALYQATSQIAAIGNNINQIARAVNSSPKEIDKAFLVDLKGVKSLIDELRGRIRNVIKGNMRSWGVVSAKPSVKKNSDEIALMFTKLKASLDEHYSQIDDLQHFVNG